VLNKSNKVVVVDYGIGNLLSVFRAFEKIGARVEVTSDSHKILKAERLVLPGVGAFADGMKNLCEYKLKDPIINFVKSQRPFLGICLGMQMMLSLSKEFGENKGLGLIPGQVVPIPPVGSNGNPHKIPHIGWNELQPGKGVDWSKTILDGILHKSSVYFVHSYTPRPESESSWLASCDYNGCPLSAVIRSGNAYGCQFHPEKSGSVGLAILKNFLSL
jgi:imidazole glycerol-phosphate synthase subunit HisH